MFLGNYWGDNYFTGTFWPPVEEGGGGTPSTLTWENAIIIDSVERATQLTTAVIPPGTWKVFIKAFDTSGNESLNATSVNHTVVTNNNVIVDQIDNPRWPGSHGNFIKHDLSGLLVPQSESLANATGFDIFDLFVFDPVDIPVYSMLELDLGFDSNVRIYAELKAILGPGESGVSDPQLEVDYRTDAGGYIGFQPWTVGTVEARFVKARTSIDTTTGVASLEKFRLVLDVEDRVEQAAGVTIAANGTTITFDKEFHISPFVNVIADSATALIATKELVTTTNFKAHVFDTDGNDVGGTVDWSAIGA